MFFSNHAVNIKEKSQKGKMIFMQFELKQKNCQNLKSITLDMHYQEI